MRIIVTIFAIALSRGLCQENPVFASKCARADWECLTRLAQAETPRFVAGFPSINIPPLDPFILSNYTTDLAGLMFTTSGQARGYKQAHLDRVQFDFERRKFRLDAVLNMTMKGRYRASGQLLFLPIQGDGDIKIKTVGAVLNITAPFDVDTASSQRHLRLGEFQLEFDIVGGVHYSLTNLFNGNKALSDAMHSFLNTNWRLVSKEFAAPVVRTGLEQLFRNMNQLFARMPLSALFSDEGEGST